MIFVYNVVMRRSLLYAGALLLVGVLPLRAGASSCPSYLNRIVPNKCNADGFCGWFDMQAVINDGGVLETDDPPAQSATFLDPWTDTTHVTVGGGDVSGIADSDFDANRGFVAAGGTARFEVPFGDSPPSGNAEGRALAVMRVTDLVFSGPDAEVETSLRVVFGADQSEIATNMQDGRRMSSMLARTNVLLGGGICNGSEYATFLGSHLRTLLDDDEGEDTLVVTETGILSQVPLAGETALMIGPFSVPTGEPLTFELWVETIVIASGNGGFARATADFSLALGPAGGGEVFVLPEGYTANSPMAGITSNTVPEPRVGLAALAAFGVLAAVRRSRGV